MSAPHFMPKKGGVKNLLFNAPSAVKKLIFTALFLEAMKKR